MASNTGAKAFAPFMAWEFIVFGGLDSSNRRASCRIHRGTRPGNGDDCAGKLCADRQWLSCRLGLRRSGGAAVHLYYGDFNGDRIVNHFDLGLWEVHGDQTVESLGYDRLYDLDNDGGIGGADGPAGLRCMAQLRRYRESGPMPSPLNTGR